MHNQNECRALLSNAPTATKTTAVESPGKTQQCIVVFCIWCFFCSWNTVTSRSRIQQMLSRRPLAPKVSLTFPLFLSAQLSVWMIWKSVGSIFPFCSDPLLFQFFSIGYQSYPSITLVASTSEVKVAVRKSVSLPKTAVCDPSSGPTLLFPSRKGFHVLLLLARSNHVQDFENVQI